MFKRVILIVLDGVGVGALPDAAAYGDAAAATLPHVAAAVGGLSLPNLERFGLGRIAAIAGVEPVTTPTACWGRMAEQSAGKDSVTGHWELAGVVLEQPFATFPDGFPPAIIDAFTETTGLRPLGNLVASGTDILRQLGEEHLRTGRPIVYTSCDSVFQIAAHEDVITLAQLYEICQQAAEILQPYNVCRVIARPFLGSCAADFYRTANRHDFSRRPLRPTLLERLAEKGVDTWGIGKIADLYAGAGVARAIPSSDNTDGMAQLLRALTEIKSGLLMTNLVDFDMLYGHRLDATGFARALEKFDRWLPHLLGRMVSDDLLLITADHGCDPTTDGTDHTREYVPLLAWTPLLQRGTALGTRSAFVDVAATVAENFQLDFEGGLSFLEKLTGLNLIKAAEA